MIGVNDEYIQLILLKIKATAYSTCSGFLWVTIDLLLF